MGFERRIFARTDIEVQGELHWSTKRVIGGTKNHMCPMQTIDLSVDGAKMLVHKSVNLPAGASVRIMFHEQSSPARVRQVWKNVDDKDTNLLRLQLESPPVEFMRIIDQWLDAKKGGRKFKENYDLGDGVVEDIFRSAS